MAENQNREILIGITMFVLAWTFVGLIVFSFLWRSFWFLLFAILVYFLMRRIHNSEYYRQQKMLKSSEKMK